MCASEREIFIRFFFLVVLSYADALYACALYIVRLQMCECRTDFYMCACVFCLCIVTACVAFVLFMSTKHFGFAHYSTLYSDS